MSTYPFGIFDPSRREGRGGSNCIVKDVAHTIVHHANCTVPGAPGHPAGKHHKCDRPQPCAVCGHPASYAHGMYHWYCTDCWQRRAPPQAPPQ